VSINILCRRSLAGRRRARKNWTTSQPGKPSASQPEAQDLFRFGLHPLEPGASAVILLANWLAQLAKLRERRRSLSHGFKTAAQQPKQANNVRIIIMKRWANRR